MRNYHPFSGPGRFYRGNLHTHTTRSDGKLSLEEVVAEYKALGYDFLAITDHRRFYREQQELDGMTLLWGMEADGTAADAPEVCHHLVAVGTQEAAYAHDQRFVSRDMRSDSLAQAHIDELTGAGNLVALAHPHWSHVQFSQYGPLRGLWAVEVFNYGCFLENDTGYAQDAWDALLAHGVRLYGIATDDGHTLRQLGGGWVCVWARDNSPEALLDGLRQGRFYASSGPQIHALDVEGDELVVRCSPCDRILFTTQSIWKDQVSVMSKSRVPVTEARYPIKQKDGYVRVSVIDAQYRIAFSQPIFIADLL